MARLKAEPNKKFLIFCLYASHGVIQDNQQMILCNEYEKESKFYRLYPAESKLREATSVYENCYVISLFACCRQRWDYDSLDMTASFDTNTGAEFQKLINEGKTLVFDKNSKQWMTEE